MKNTHLKHSNKNSTPALIACISCVCVLLLLTACGQRGALYIPNTPEAAQRSTIGDVLTKPAANPSATPSTTTSPAPAK